MNINNIRSIKFESDKGKPVQADNKMALRNCSTVTVKKSIPDLIYLRHINSAYHLIASSPGFSPEGSRDRAGYGTFGEVQGTAKFRKIVSLYAWQNPEIFSRQNIRTLKKVNPDLYRIIRNKFIGHVLNFKGKFPVNNKKYDYEGSCEDFLHPFLWNYLKEFFDSKHSSNFSEDDKQWILEHFNSTLSHHRITTKSLSNAVAAVNSGKKPVLVIGGYNWHGVAFAFINRQMIYWDSNYESIKIYKLEKDISKNSLEKIIQRHQLTKEDFHYTYNEIESLTNQISDEFEKQKQKTGNCIYKASKGLIQIMVTVKSAISNAKTDIECNDFENTEKKFKTFSNFLRSKVISDLIEDYNLIEENPKFLEEQRNIIKIFQLILAEDIAKTNEGKPVLLTDSQLVLIESILDAS